MDDLSVCRSVRRCVGLSSALWKNGGSDPDAIWHHRSDGLGMRQVVGFGDCSTEGVLLGANLGRAIVTNGDFTAYVCVSASTVGAAVWGGACVRSRHCCIRWGPRRAREGEALGFPIFTMGNAFGSPTVKCFRFVCENFTTFPFGKRIIGKLDSCAFLRYIQFQD